MGGKEAINHLIKMDQNVRAIVSSGYSSDPVMANYTRYGFCGAVKKPYMIARDEPDAQYGYQKEIEFLLIT
jgi:hypothetical protein